MGAAREVSTPQTKTGQLSSHPTALNPSPTAVCRICHEDGRNESLVSPCRCSGSVGLVHVHCLEKWLTSANKNHCEICMFKYSTKRHPKPIHQWLCGLSLADESRRHLCGDSACFMLITSLAMLGDYLCLLGISHYLMQMKRWQAVGLMILAFVISLVYIAWLLVTCKYHWTVWREWRRENQQVRLVRVHSISPVPAATGATNNNNNNIGDGMGTPAERQSVASDRRDRTGSLHSECSVFDSVHDTAFIDHSDNTPV